VTQVDKPAGGPLTSSLDLVDDPLVPALTTVTVRSPSFYPAPARA